MDAFLPKQVSDEIKKHLRSAGKQAEAGWESASADEDTLTGDFGAALRRDLKWTRDDTGKVWGWRMTYVKFGGRGDGAPEKSLGADGIFQITLFLQVTKEQFHKGLLFQSKKVGTTKFGSLQEQAQKMEDLVPGGSCVLEFGPKTYRACDSSDVLHAARLSDGMADAKQVGSYLASEFLPCHHGKMGLYYDGGRKTLVVPDETTGVKKVRALLKHKMSIEVVKSD